MNIQQMMKQAQQMQRKLQENQEALKSMEFEGTSGGNMINIKMMGTGLVKSININKSVIDPDDKETLEDLLTVAFNNAKEKLDKKADEFFGNAGSGIDLKNFKLPF